jgi:hypothetical protein
MLVQPDCVASKTAGDIQCAAGCQQPRGSLNFLGRCCSHKG